MVEKIRRQFLRDMCTATLGVVALSGYINSPNYEPLVFSIVVNQSDQPTSVLRQTIDRIVLFLTRLQRC